MNIWVDAQLPPTLVSWLNNIFEANCPQTRSLGLYKQSLPTQAY
jgi:predicted nuclease of predicted toxin-antitoxin system